MNKIRGLSWALTVIITLGFGAFALGYIAIPSNVIEVDAYGNTYVGTVSNGQFVGKTHITFTDGMTYEGTLKDGQFEGEGTLSSPDGWTIVGRFQQGQLMNVTQMLSANSITYTGSLVDGQPINAGTFTANLRLPQSTSKLEQSITIIGDSVLLGAKMFGKLDEKLAALPGISKVNVDARGSRQLAKGISIVKKLKAKNNLGDIVIFALATNGHFNQEKALKAIKAAGDRQIIFVTGYNRGYKYPNESNKAVKALAKQHANVYIADWNKVAKKHGLEALSDRRCHLSHAGATWYINVLIDTIKTMQKQQVASSTQPTPPAPENPTPLIPDAPVPPAPDVSDYGTGQLETTPSQVTIPVANLATATFQSTNPNIVSVNITGTITAQAQGNAEVIATSNGETIIIHVNVT